jgi:actin-related protein 3
MSSYFIVHRYTKMGFAGNDQPQFVIPSAIATKGSAVGGTGKVGSSASTDTYDVLIGDEAMAASKSHSIGYPIRHGQVENWDWMEAYWAQSYFKYLRVNPEDHRVLLTEPPVNAPSNREMTAEIMFETFNVPAMYIAVQAVLALASSWGSAKVTSERLLTGTVIDSGDGVTHIIPVVEGYAIASAIKHIPIAGRDVSLFIQQLLRDRGTTGVSPENSLEVARRIKEELCYVCPDMAKEFQKYDKEPGRMVQQFEWTAPGTKQSISFPVGHERFMGPEVFFNPEIASAEFTTPLPNLVDEVIQTCPIDGRRDLYKNIVLSGGSTMFKDFSKRLQRDLSRIVEDRLAYTQELDHVVNKTGQIDVNIVSHKNQRYAVWNGGSLLASMDQFTAYCHTKAEYEENGPSICRQSRVFGSLLQ